MWTFQSHINQQKIISNRKLDTILINSDRTNISKITNGEKKLKLFRDPSHIFNSSDRRKLLHHTKTNSILIQHHPLLTESHHTTQIIPVWKEPGKHTCKPSACTAIQQKKREKVGSKESKPVLQ